MTEIISTAALELTTDTAGLQKGIVEAKAAGAQLTSAFEGAGGSIGGANTALSGFSGGLNSFGKQMASTMAGFVSAQAIIGIFRTSWHELTAFVADSLEAWDQQELSIKKLGVAIDAAGMAVPSTLKQFVDLSAEFQRNTVYGDEAIQTVEALLVELGGVGPAQMQKAVAATLDLASALGIDLNTAAVLVGKAAAGQTQTLTRYGIVLDQSRVHAEGLTYVLDQMGAKFGGQAQTDAQTYGGQVKQLGNLWGDYQEQVGRAIAQDPLLRAALRASKSAIEEQTGALQASNDGMGGHADRAGAATTATDGLMSASGRLVAFFAGQYNGALVDAATNLVSYDNAAGDLEQTIARLQDRAAKKAPGLLDWLTMVPAAAGQASQAVAEFEHSNKEAEAGVRANIKAIDALAERLSGADLQTQADQLAAAWAQLTEAQRESPAVILRTAEAAATLRDKGATLIPVLAQLAKVSGQMSDGINVVAAGFQDALPGISLNTDAMLDHGQALVDDAKSAAAWQVANDEIIQSQNALFGVTGEATDQTEANAAAVGDATGTLQLYGQTVATVRGHVDVLGESFSSMGQEVQGSVADLQRAAKEMDEAYGRAGFVVQASSAASAFWWNAGRTAVPGFATGVEGFAGGAAIVGERGPELLTLPPGSDVTPLPTGGGLTVVAQVDAKGAFFPSRNDLAAFGNVIGGAILARARAQGYRF